MPKFGSASMKNLLTCDARLQVLAETVVKYHDCSCIEGWRSEDEQNKHVDAGRSKVRWPDGKHNRTTPEGLPCSLAVHLFRTLILTGKTENGFIISQALC
jgi:hypothetical protein